MFLVHQKIDHLAQGHLGRFVQIFVNAHSNEMRGRFRARPFQVHVLANYKLKSPDQRGFHRGDVDFAVALARVAVAGEKQRAFRMNRNE